MKNLINILLYVLLALLVVAISVMIYKRFKSNSDLTTTGEAQADLAYVDSTNTQALPFTSEDSIILGLTGELPTQVGPDADHNSSTETTSTPAIPQENVAPVAQPVVMRESTSKPSTTANKATETTAKKTETKSSTVKLETKTDSKTSAKVKKTETKASSSSTNVATEAKGNYYVVSGSFLVPNNADNQVAKLKKMGFFNAKKIVFKNSSSYSAIAGQYESDAAAKASLKKLKAKGEEGFIKKI